MDLYFVFGKKLYKNDQPDWILQARCDLAISLVQSDRKAKLVVSGYKSAGTISEAQAMKHYILTKDPSLESNLIIEEAGNSTIHQLCVLKERFVLKEGYKDIGLVSDELHMRRILFTARQIFGGMVNIKEYKAEVKLSGKYFDAIKNLENALYLLLVKNPLVNLITAGDHKAWLEYERFHQERAKRSEAADVDINEEYRKYLEGRNRK